jgi:hypothetical protein
MYYHCRPLKYVKYGTVEPPPSYKKENWLVPCYKWLGEYCGFYPQVWLARGQQAITGMKMNTKRSKEGPNIVFGFEHIKGFGIDYALWHNIMNILTGPDSQDIVFDAEAKESVKDTLAKRLKWEATHGVTEEYWTETDLANYPAISWWKENDDIDEWMEKFLFAENDQVVVPRLNLKSAKKVFCENEKIKKKLRKMGFIEDRIQIRNFKQRNW